MNIGFGGSIEELQGQSRQLAQSEEARQDWFRNTTEKNDVIQQAIQIWTTAIESRQTNRDIDEGGKIVEASILEAAQDEQIQRAILAARILRNASVGSPDCQQMCYEAVPSITRILWITTSYAFQNDNEVHIFTRTLIQFLSNMITMNEELQDRIWNQILFNDGKEAENGSRTGADLFGRLLQSRDAATSTATQILLLNCTLDSKQRCQSLSGSTSGAKVLSSMLEIVQQHLESEERHEDNTSSSAEGQSEHLQKQYESLGVVYTFFTNLFDQQLFGSVFVHLGPGEVIGQTSITSLISQSQLALLKLLDSYLHYGALSYRKDNSDDTEPTEGLYELTTAFERLARWAERVMKDALEGGTKGHVDPRLFEVHIGLVLLLQCLITLGMKTENDEGKEEEIKMVGIEMLGKMRGVPFVQLLVSLLHTLAEFAPPISPFRPTTASPGQAPAPPPQDHSLTSTGAAVFTDASESGPGLDNLKRDIVNLLGVLSYKRQSDDKEQVLLVQDTVREAGGLFDVMNMTQLDEHNPYIRERAIFTLRNLLLGNPTSQDMVSKLKPMPQ